MKPSMILAAAAISLSFPATSICQRPERERAPRDRPRMIEPTSTNRRTATVNLMGERIRLLNPDIASELIDQDEMVVAEALSEVKTRLARDGFQEADAEDAVFAAWALLRVGYKSGDLFVALTLPVLVNNVEGLGKLVVDSDPQGARVDLTMDRHSIKDETESRQWVPGGTWKLRLSKPGYRTIEETVSVRSRKKTEIKRTLSPM